MVYGPHRNHFLPTESLIGYYMRDLIVFVAGCVAVLPAALIIFWSNTH